MLSAADLLTTLGPDTVELVIRRDVDPPALDLWGRPLQAETVTQRGGSSWIVRAGTEELGTATIATLEATGALPVDSQTESLRSGDAIRHGGRLFELTTPAVTHVDGFGRVSHVRVYGRWAADVSLGEQVVIVAAGRRHDGIVDPDGDPVPVIARGVTPGNATVRFGGEGATTAADYTVVLDLDTQIADGDWLIVRGVECRAVVERQESQWVERRQLVVLAQSRRSAI